MSWDSSRPIPWKRLGLWLGIYAALMIGVTLATKPKDAAGVLPGVFLGVVVAATLLIVLTKLGWKMPMLQSREELAVARAQRLAARNSARSGSGKSSRSAAAVDAVVGPRPKAAPTSRTSTGPSQHPRRTSKTRKR